MKMFETKRQHPAMIILETLHSLKYALLPLFLMFLSGLTEGEYLRSVAIFLGLSIAFFLGFLVYQVPKWAFYTYRLEADYLHIKAGFVFKKERSIKRERVQTVNIRTGIVQRLLGLATLEVETAGGGHESELSLTAVHLEEARRIKGQLEGRQEETKESRGKELVGTPTGEKEFNAFERSRLEGSKEDVYRASFSELFLAGATSGGFLVLFSIITAVFSQFYPMFPDAFWEYLLDQVTSTTAATVVLVVLVLLLLSWLISSLGFMIKYANFTLIRREDHLQVSWGLIEQKQLALNLHRLQAISIEEGIFRQPLGRCALTVEVAGGGSRDENYVTMLFPLLHCSELNKFLARVLPEYHLPETIQPLPGRSRRRYIFRSTVPVLLAVSALQLAPWPYLWWGFLLLVPAFFLGLSRYYAGGTAIEGGQLTFRYRNLSRYRVLMQRKHLQALEVNSNPFQRWWRLRSVRASVLSSPYGKTFQVTDVDQDEASRLWKWYSRYL